MPKTISRLFLTAACMAMALSVQAYTFTKIADTNTAIPNGTGTFTGLSTAHISQSNIVFAAKGSSGQQGFYRWKDSVLTRLVDKNMTAPGFGTTFTNLPDYDSKFSEVNDFLFTGITAGGQGLYRWNSFNDTVDSLVDTTYNIPGLSEKFKTLRSLDQVQPPGRTVFVGYSSNFTEGIYFLSGTNITTLITTNDALPGTSATFLGTDNIVLDGAYAAFSPYRSDSSRGVYCYSYASNQIFAIADTNTVVPGKAIKFTGFTDPPTLHNGTVVFYGSYAGGAGLFSANADGTSLTKL
ncbi:MAG: hypothetical protein JWM68_4753, partial [Verrucomicrobiales bacterium]|nr:hypothetical protein [Verrucomicrobiales bacterium]